MRPSALIGAVLLTAIVALPGLTEGPALGSGDPATPAAGEIIVKFREGTNARVETRVHLREDGLPVEELGEAQKVDLPDGTSIEEAVRDYEAHGVVEYAEPNHILRVAALPNDPELGSQWALVTIRAAAAWGLALGEPSVIVAVIDTGVRASHPDLAGQVLPGYDFVNQDSNADDDHGHGTLIAGVIAARYNNNVGVSGLAPGVRILPIKALSANGIGTDFDVAKGIRWAADKGAKIVNLSLGGPEESKSMQEAVDYAHARGVTVIAAAGNEGKSSIYYPAAGRNVIAVGATDRSDRRAGFSNYGKGLSVTAPGVAVLTTSYKGDYSYVSGTSIATPHVAGLAALMVSRNPSLVPDQVQDLMQRATADLGKGGWDAEFGHGRIDAPGAVQRAAAAPGSGGSTSGSGAPVIPRRYVSPNPFSPNFDGYRDAGAICYYLEQPAKVTISIHSYKGRESWLLRDGLRQAGESCTAWTGTNWRGNVLPYGNYRYVLRATNPATGGFREVTGVIATRQYTPPPGGDKVNIDRVDVSPNPFGVHALAGPRATGFTYFTDGDAAITLRIYSYRGEVKTLLAGQVRPGGVNTVGWTGTDYRYKVLPPGNYRYILSATNAQGVRTYSGIVAVR